MKLGYATIFSTKTQVKSMCLPTWQQVIDWFREKYKLYILISEYYWKLAIFNLQVE